MQAAYGKCTCEHSTRVWRNWKDRSGEKMETPAKIAASCLGEMGNTAASRRARKETVAVIFALGEIGKSVTWQRLGDVASSTVALLGETGKVAASQKFEDAALNAELLLQEIGTGAIEKPERNCGYKCSFYP